MSGESTACQINSYLKFSMYIINAFSWFVLLNDKYKRKKTTNQIVESSMAVVRSYVNIAEGLTGLSAKT